MEIISPSPDVLAMFVAAGDKVHQEYSKKIGADYLKEVYAVTGYKK